MTTDDDFDAVQDAISVLEDNGFEVDQVERIMGFEATEYDDETEESIPLGHESHFTLNVVKEHF